ncbi:HAD hydrolase family protein [Psychrobacillus sp. FSL W7-1457]|uniref:HAD hydrolase family protein n=1 Tax=unclassified Psychrobacillus TaxID=2636677 RepID=UPI0030F5A5CC
MTILFASDLDRTLIYSKKSRGLEVNEQDLAIVEWRENNPAAFMTKEGLEIFKELSSSIEFLPVTTRTSKQYERLFRLYNPQEKPTYSIVSNGAVILENGKPIPEWSDKIEVQLENDCTSVSHVLSQIEPYIQRGSVLKSLQAENWFVYMIIDEERFTVEDLEDLSQLFYKQGFTLSKQGRKLYVMPNCINKSLALEFVSDRIEAETVIAAGDSLLDLDMVLSADYGFIPQHGEVILNKSHLPPHVQVTDQSGVLAGEEIIKKVHNICYNMY